MNHITKNTLYIIGAMLFFAMIALAYNAPLLSGNQALSQPDIINYKGSAQEMQQYRQQTGDETYWSNAMFGGMPTYQTGANYDYHWVKKLDETLRFLPRPADYMFLMFAGFFLLGMVLFKNCKYAVLGACLFAMGTYFFQLFEAGHNAKAHAIAYFAPLTAGILLLYRKKYIIGFLLTALFMALELVANHPQMTYYLGFVIVVYIILEGVQHFKNQQIKPFFLSSILAIGAVLLGIGMNASGLLATYEYGQYSTRGKNDISILKGDNESGLNKDYITQWSYGKLETLNLFIPDFMGGGTISDIENKENLSKAIQQNAQSPEEYQYFSQAIDMIPTYWGNQPFTSGPAYQGAVVILLFILGLFLVKGKFKWWLTIVTILSILLAWGKNMMWFTDFFIDFVPLYDKFRAVSSILVMAEFAMPLLGVLAIYQFFQDKDLSTAYKKKVLLYAGGGTVGLLLIFYMLGESLFGFQSDFDLQLPAYMQKGIIADRVSMFRNDLLRTLLFVVLSLSLLAAYIWGKIQRKEIVIAGIALLTIIDLWGIDKRYLNEENYIPKKYVDYPFPTEMTDRLYADAQSNPTLMQIAAKVPVNQQLSVIKQNDKGHYRVYNAVSSTFNDASTSYFNSSIGGYHGAKLQNFQNIIDVYLSRDSVLQQSLGVVGGEQNILNMLNTKYFVINGEQGPQAIENPDALGNAWFVKNLITAKDQNEAIINLGKINPKDEGLINGMGGEFDNSNAVIALKSYQPNRLVYQTQNPKAGYAIFSEIYYPKGWTATIDGKLANIDQANYFLRGMSVPKGNHEIVFEFKPEIVKNGGVIMMSSHIIFILLFFGGLWFWFKQRNQTIENQ